MREQRCNIPNAVTFIRVILLGVMWFFFFLRQSRVLGILLAVSLFTDFLDGYLARRLKQETRLGARFDSLADNILGLSIIIWMPFLLRKMFLENILIISIAVSMAVLAWLLAFQKQTTAHSDPGEWFHGFFKRPVFINLFTKK